LGEDRGVVTPVATNISPVVSSLQAFLPTPIGAQFIAPLGLDESSPYKGLGEWIWERGQVLGAQVFQPVKIPWPPLLKLFVTILP
jgi:hypothetical protein